MKRMMVRTSLLLLLVGGSLSVRSLGATPGATLAVPTAVEAEAKSAAAEDALYAKGTKAMDEQRWADAVSSFDGVVAARSKRADAAMYWKAYSLDKLGRKEEAGAVCGALRGEHPESTWNKECRVLQARASFDGPGLAEFARAQAELGRAQAELARPFIYDSGDWQSFGNGGVRVLRKDRTTTDEDIKILALNSLMQQDPAKGLPLLRDLIRSDKPVELRRQALFVLSRSKQPEAQGLLKEVALNKNDVALQKEAVQMLGMYRSKDSGQTLVDVYRGSSDASVKRAAVNGLFLAHDATRLVDLARNEKDLNQKRDIVAQLALMKDPAATDYMMELLK